MSREVVRFKRNKVQLVDTLDKMITLLEQSDIHVLSCVVTRYRSERTLLGDNNVKEDMVPEEATLILNVISDWSQDRLESFKLGEFFN